MAKLFQMIELRYLVPDGTRTPDAIPRLQYRWVAPNIDASGAMCPPGQWSDWHDVPVVTESQKAPS